MAESPRNRLMAVAAASQTAAALPEAGGQLEQLLGRGPAPDPLEVLGHEPGQTGQLGVPDLLAASTAATRSAPSPGPAVAAARSAQSTSRARAARDSPAACNRSAASARTKSSWR